jgi:two-component system response regulator FlrC
MRENRNKTVLVVEDNDAMRKAMLETLKVLGYATLEAENGAEAIRLLEVKDQSGSDHPGRQVALIMSDLTMPEMGGQELFFELRKRGINIPLIMLTGYTVTNELDELCKQGLSGWLQKPADIDQIDDLLHKLLD